MMVSIFWYMLYITMPTKRDHSTGEGRAFAKILGLTKLPGMASDVGRVKRRSFLSRLLSLGSS